MKYLVQKTFILKGRVLKPGMEINSETMALFASTDFQPMVDSGRLTPLVEPSKTDNSKALAKKQSVEDENSSRNVKRKKD